MPDDLRKLLDPLRAVLAARPKYRQVPASTYMPPTTVDNPAPTPVVMPATTEVYVDPAELPHEVVSGAGVDLGAQLALVQAAIGRFADLQIRTVTGQATFSPVVPLIWLPGQYYDVDVAWNAPPLAAPKGAVARVDASVVALGRIQAWVLDESVSMAGCKVRCRVVGAGNISIGLGTPLTVSATGLYLYWMPFTEGTTT